MFLFAGLRNAIEATRSAGRGQVEHALDWRRVDRYSRGREVLAQHLPDAMVIPSRSG